MDVEGREKEGAVCREDGERGGARTSLCEVVVATSGGSSDSLLTSVGRRRVGVVSRLRAGSLLRLVVLSCKLAVDVEGREKEGAVCREDGERGGARTSLCEVVVATSGGSSDSLLTSVGRRRVGVVSRLRAGSLVVLSCGTKSLSAVSRERSGRGRGAGVT